MASVNGCEQQKLVITDRATQYGDGCFTTILVEQQRVQLWSLHLARLKVSLQRLGIAAPDWPQVYTDITALALKYPHKGGIKILVSRGSGGRGYNPIGCNDTQVIISHFEWPAHYQQWQQQGIILGVCQQRMGNSPMLAGMKHLNRLEQVLLKQEIETAGWVDAIALDCGERVIETSIANLFWRQGNTVYTPALQRAGVAGVMRQHVLDILDELNYDYQVGDFDLDALLAADEVFITNALMALVPVNQIHTTQYCERTMFKTLWKRLHSC
ncbi:aminodeoxychorismate lyase [Photobacterium phosphoreum]|uniref:Aminodeoxychorismate lyase n=1 Tax=Photobacterium phosphoreum TaxID=659 RepID=A0A2T3PQ89_PHOPO|nr:aminodeoxychorismate lyase [Photobacterium phosphoreum]PSU26136.1 aminodeoxychorismate lyase [Photobacterium phosphoreum]PSU44073.1 aminodeoxychorismate lyase [Photobacterium phosphoreum]PSU52913.1 aminodeoxychorismate lyase [Photobacterium phosphoreum]PSU80951.1 aminodeoxychorismate lyase [Photobacterium phosphoreum]PSW34780.1 aminodeoxychorismate lyase [Photobacterium phosphoreum]